MTQFPLKHVVFIGGLGMTHIRPSLHLCARLTAKFSNLFITVYIFGPLASQADQYLSTYHKDARRRVRIVPSAVDAPITGPLDFLLSLERSFGPWISEQVASSSMNVNGLVVNAPSYIIEDHICGGIALANKEFHGLPVASWWVASAVSYLSHFGDEGYGNGGRLLDAVIANLEKQEPGSERSIEEILAQEMSGRVICAPGLLPHYEHEQLTQLTRDKFPLVVQLRKRWRHMLEHTSMVVFTGVYEMEPVVAEVCANAFSQPLASFSVGLAADLPPPVTPHFDPDTSDPVLSFMNRAYTDLGPNSVIYIAFGTVFFPPPESSRHLKVLVEEILAQGFKVVFSIKPEHSKAAGLDEEYIEKLTKGGLAIFPDWVNQLEVLEHPALHYFVSHGGWNSTTEAIVRGVPMIFWPVGGDQPINSMHVARQHDCGFELMQVRSGPAKSVAYGPDGDIEIIGSTKAVREEVQKVLEMTKGGRGTQQRLNVKALGKVARRATESGGSGDVALERFGKAIGL
ncbi:hypothetical protein FS749_004704 [Ceratobasidium sp. UAMH 11750]|nr:hypothetical protein FS749_004704 [Ceratobasidium sp. UAMH 11750]